MNTNTATTNNELQDANNIFWKSQSMDTINQLLSGCHNMQTPMTPIGADVKVEGTNYLFPSPSGTSITSSLSFSSILPSLSGNTPSSNGFLIQPTLSQTGMNQLNPSSPINITSSTSETTMTSITPITPTKPVGQNNAPAISNSSSAMVQFHHNQQLAHIQNPAKEVVKVDKEPTYVDVTPFLILPQHEAARRLGVPCSTLSKRWKEASVNRKWPYRIVCKLDKEITTLLKNVENNASMVTTPLSPAIEENLGVLLKKRQEELRTVVIRIN